MHILVIEDNPDLAANLCDFLEAKGHSVDGLKHCPRWMFDTV